jgi:hypothetical protein
MIASDRGSRAWTAPWTTEYSRPPACPPPAPSFTYPQPSTANSFYPGKEGNPSLTGGASPPLPPGAIHTHPATSGLPLGTVWKRGCLNRTLRCASSSVTAPPCARRARRKRSPVWGRAPPRTPSLNPPCGGYIRRGRKCDIFYLARYPRFLAAPTEIPISWAISFHDNPRALKSMT